MDLRRKWTHITNHSGWSKSSHGGMVSWFQIRCSKLHFSLLCFKLQSRSLCIPLYEHQNLLIIGQSQRVGSLNSSRLISSYKSSENLAGRSHASRWEGTVAAYFFYSNARINPEKLLMTKWTAVETKRTHFIITKLIRATDETIVAVSLKLWSIKTTMKWTGVNLKTQMSGKRDGNKTAHR